MSAIKPTSSQRDLRCLRPEEHRSREDFIRRSLRILYLVTRARFAPAPTFMSQVRAPRLDTRRAALMSRLALLCRSSRKRLLMQVHLRQMLSARWSTYAISMTPKRSQKRISKPSTRSVQPAPSFE